MDTPPFILGTSLTAAASHFTHSREILLYPLMCVTLNTMFYFLLAGTGKSSIVCAICLGLGGQAKLLGRAKDVRTFFFLLH